MRKALPKKRRQVNPIPAKRYYKKDFPTKKDTNLPTSQTTGDKPKDNKGMGNIFTYILIGLAIGIGYVVITKKK
jgi:hypothetical protein